MGGTRATLCNAFRCGSGALDKSTRGLHESGVSFPHRHASRHDSSRRLESHTAKISPSPTAPISLFGNNNHLTKDLSVRGSLRGPCRCAPRCLALEIAIWPVITHTLNSNQVERGCFLFRMGMRAWQPCLLIECNTTIRPRRHAH